MKSAMSTVIGIALALGTGNAMAQAAAKAPMSKPVKETGTTATVVPGQQPPVAVPAFPAAGPETTLDGCRDGVDNDVDGHVDCADQDCWIYAMCVPAEAPSPPIQAPPPPVQYVAVVPVAPGPERFHQCRDGIDNNNDGLTDCFEPSCQRGSHCRREMYFVPEPADKAPGLLLSLGIGLAMPNYRRPTASVDSLRYGEEIPFSPDLGIMASFQLGYLPVPWFGLGVNFMGGVSGASSLWGVDDVDDGPYKYDGFKNFAHAGGFLRLQYPAGRFVPYIDIAGGYSYARFQWEVYDGRETWDDIDDYHAGDSSLYYSRDRHVQTTRHFTMALQPGADFFVRPRSVAIGVKLWLPVFALPYGESSTDNIGVMLNVTFLPSWRERPRLKPEYEQALAQPGPAAAAAAPKPAPEPGATAVEPVEWEPEPVAPAPEPVAPAPEPAAPGA